MKDLRNTVLEIASKQLDGMSPYFWLFEVRVPTDPPTRFRITNYTQPIARGVDSGGHSIIFYPFPIAQGDLLQQAKGDLTEMTFNITNVTLELATILDSYDGLSGQPVVVRLVHSEGVTDPNAELRSDGEVTRCRVTGDVFSFSVSAKNLLKELFPKRRLMAYRCGSTFGGAECGYSIPTTTGETVGTGFSTCSRELEACEERGLDEVARSLTRLHPLRFNAAPGMRSGTT